MSRAVAIGAVLVVSILLTLNLSKAQPPPNPPTGIPLGVMVPFFGKDLPNGFVWADGNTVWPDQAWVPEHLRDKEKVPNMSEQLIGGAKDGNSVGRVFEAGTLVFPNTAFIHDRIAVEGASEAGGLVRGPPKSDTPWRVSREDPENGSKNGGVYFEPYATPFYRKTVGLKLKLDTAGTNPRHVMCKWIIRVK